MTNSKLTALSLPDFCPDHCKGLSKIKLAHSCGILLASPSWRNRHGTHELAQVVVHRDGTIAEGKCPPAVHGPHCQRTGTRRATTCGTRPRVEPDDHSPRHARADKWGHLPRCLCGPWSQARGSPSPEPVVRPQSHCR